MSHHMSHKKKTKPTSVVPGGSAPATLEGTAQAALAASRFKDAIEQFKELLKRERRSAWLAGLAAAYAGRAEQLASKDMVKEALALWRTRADACNVPLLSGPYVAWLLKSGQIEQALGLLATVDKLPPEAQALAQAQLAAAALVAPDALLAGLPAGNPLLLHRAAARAALAACTKGELAASAKGDETALAQALQTISFRSPYRDLRPLLKALALLASDPQGAAATLARVPENGPFEPLAKALRVGLLPGIEWLSGLLALDEPGRALVLDLKGCPPSQRLLVLDLAARTGVTATSATSPLELFDLVLRHRKAMAGGLAQQIGLRLLPHVPQRLDAFRTSLVPLAPAEQERLLALAAELKQQDEQAETHWLRFVKLSGATLAGRQQAALVLRRLADSHSQHGFDGKLCSHALAWLEQSLDFDPADRGTHLRLVRDARCHLDLKQARTWLDAARQRFPDDMPLLLEAVEIALAAGAFKKAAGLAKQVLQVDPINPRVRTLIGQAHLSHARKQIAANNPQAALRELDEAANWLRNAADRSLLTLLRGLATESGVAGDSLLRDAMAELGAPLVGAFHLLLEGQRSKRPPQDLLRRAGVDLTAAPSTADVVALAQALNALPERDGAARSAIKVLRKPLESAVSALQFSEGDQLLLCEALHRQGQTELTLRVAAAALRRWPQRPVFLYLEAAARYGANPWAMPQHDWQRLDTLYDQAKAQGDQRTAARLSQLLGAAGHGQPGDDFDPDEDEFGADDVRTMMEMMLTAGGEDAFLDMARQQLGKASFDQLRREIKGSKQQFARALLDLVAPTGPEPSGPARRPPFPKVTAPKPPARPPSPRSPLAPNQTDLFDD